MCKIRKELYTYVAIFFILSLAMHFNAWLNHPMEHISALSSSSLGAFHPFLITLIVYMIWLVLRVVFTFFSKLIKK